jgi:zinc protease
MLTPALLLVAAIAGSPNRVVETTLPNGLVVTIVADPSMPVVATQVWYHVGSANEGAANRGLAHLFEHLMFGATSAYEAGAYSKLVAAAGGDDNAFTSPDETVYVAEVPPEVYPEVIRREGDRMRHLAITQANLDKEKKIVTEELRLRGENDPLARLLIKAQKALLGSHPYAFDPTGSKDDVAAATVAQCRAFYDAYYHPNNAHVVVAGSVDPDAALATIREAFGGYPRGGSTPPDVPPLFGWPFPARLDLKEDIPPVEVALFGTPLPAAGTPDAEAAQVLIAMLTGHASDPLREIIVTRERKAVEAGIQAISLRRGGGLVFYSASLPYRTKRTAQRVLDEAVEELSGMAWLTDTSLDAAKRKLIRERAQEGVYAAEVAHTVGEALWWEGQSSRAFDRAARLDAVTKDQVAAAWRTYVRDAAPIRVYVKPERVPALIRMFGWLYPLFS